MRQLVSAMQLRVLKLFEIGKEVVITTKSKGQTLSIGRSAIMAALFNPSTINLITADTTLTEEDNGKIFYKAIERKLQKKEKLNLLKRVER